MANPVWHTVLRLELDLNEQDLGHPDLTGLWEQLYQQDRLFAARRVPVAQRGLQCAGVCRAQGVVAWMYLRERDGRREAVHEHKADQARHAAMESDEHKAYKERIIHVAVEAGHHADTEVASGRRRVITDAVVHGPHGLKIGWEVQLSDPESHGPRTVRSRVRKAQSFGLVSAWHTDRRSFDGRQDAHWTRTDNLPAEAIRAERDLLVRSGVRRLIWERCDTRRAEPCPDRRTGRCGRLHPRPEPYPVQFDELVRRTASGLLVPIDFRMRTRVNRFWVPADDRDRYLDAMGGEQADDEEQSLLPADKASQRGPTCRPRIEISRPSVVLDWSARTHFAKNPGTCRICGKTSHLLDDQGRHACKVCVQEEAASQQHPDTP